MDGLKQRVIGALVLISLAVIFIPMLFDEPHEEQSSQVIPIPDKPLLPTITIAQPKPVEPQRELSTEAEPGVASDDFGPNGQQPAESDNASSWEVVDLPEEKSPESQTKPAVAPKPVTESKPAAEAKPVASAEPATKPTAPAATKPAVVETPAANIKPGADAWTIQIGTFKNRENANALKDKLRAQGFQSYTQEIKSTEGVLVRVFAGPYASNDAAQAGKSKVSQQLGMNGLVVKYTP